MYYLYYELLKSKPSLVSDEMDTSNFDPFLWLGTVVHYNTEKWLPCVFVPFPFLFIALH